MVIPAAAEAARLPDESAPIPTRDREPAAPAPVPRPLSTTRGGPTSRPRPLPWLAGGVGAVLMIGLGAWFLTRQFGTADVALQRPDELQVASAPPTGPLPTTTPTEGVPPRPDVPVGPAPAPAKGSGDTAIAPPADPMTPADPTPPAGPSPAPARAEAPPPRPVPPVEPKTPPAPTGDRPAPPMPEVRPAAGDKLAPRLTASVKWGFKEGSSNFGHVTPHCWTAAVSVAPGDERTWTAVPDLVVGEAAGTEALAQGASALWAIRPALTFFGSQSGGEIPFDTSGKVSPLLIIGDTFIFGHQIKRDWRVNDKSALWKPTPLARADRLDCVWEYATGTTFNAQAKGKADYRPFHLGPLLYDAADPAGPCYALAAFGEKVPGRWGEWVCDRPEVIPLTREAIRTEITRPDRPDEWRMQFLVWYWSQPRPVSDAGEILLRELKGTEYSRVMKLGAAASLLALEHRPAFPVVAALVRDKAENKVFRKTLLTSHGAHAAIGIGPLTAIARDEADESSVREAALDGLARHGAAGWEVVRELRADRAIGPKATRMLAERDKK